MRFFWLKAVRIHFMVKSQPTFLLHPLACSTCSTSGAGEHFEVHLESDKKSELLTSLSENQSPTATIEFKVRGCGRFRAYSFQVPLKFKLGNTVVDFEYEPATGLLTIVIPVPEEETYRWPIEIQV